MQILGQFLVQINSQNIRNLSKSLLPHWLRLELSMSELAKRTLYFQKVIVWFNHVAKHIIGGLMVEANHALFGVRVIGLLVVL